MRLFRPIFLALLAALLPFPLLLAAEERFDLVVYGGTPAGIAAAVTAARGGASVVMIEPTRWVGGMITGGLGKTDTGNEKVIGGFAREFFTRAAAAKPGTPMWFAEPHVNLATFEKLLAEAKVTVVKSQSLAAVTRDGPRISAITLADGRTFAGRVFVDATYEGDLMARAGVKYIVGRESTAQYGESLAGFHPMPIRPRSPEVMGDDCACVGGHGPHYIHGTPAAIPALDAAGKPIFGVSETKAAAGSADGLTQAYNFRIIVTRDAANRVPFPKPTNYDPARYELLVRLLAVYPQTRFGRLFHLGAVAGGKYDLNAQGVFSTDYPGGNTGYPDGDAATRVRIWQDHIDYNQGLLYFLGHDPRVPEKLRAEANEWGLAADEFTDNAHWPYALYVREARRMIGAHVLTQKDLQQDIVKPDTIGMGSFLIDCHIVQRLVTADGYVTDEGSFIDAPVRPYQIPYRSLVPQKSECENLLVPVCLSASHIAYCSLRMEPQYMICGQASGVAALLALEKNAAVQDIDVPALQARLREQGAVLALPPPPDLSALGGIVVDDDAAEFAGDWTFSSFGDPLGTGSRHDENSHKGEKSARFTVKIPAAGRYEVRLAYVAAANRAAAVPVTIAHAAGTATATVNEKLPPPLGQHFVSLGTFPFTPAQPAVITISNAGTTGFVGIDAVQLLPVNDIGGAPR